jgi:hypothetical protein
MNFRIKKNYDVAYKEVSDITNENTRENDLWFKKYCKIDILNQRSQSSQLNSTQLYACLISMSVKYFLKLHSSTMINQ